MLLSVSNGLSIVIPCCSTLSSLQRRTGHAVDPKPFRSICCCQFLMVYLLSFPVAAHFSSLQRRTGLAVDPERFRSMCYCQFLMVYLLSFPVAPHFHLSNDVLVLQLILSALDLCAIVSFLMVYCHSLLLHTFISPTTYWSCS